MRQVIVARLTSGYSFRNHIFFVGTLVVGFILYMTIHYLHEQGVKMIFSLVVDMTDASELNRNEGQNLWAYNQQWLVLNAVGTQRRSSHAGRVGSELKQTLRLAAVVIALPAAPSRSYFLIKVEEATLNRLTHHSGASFPISKDQYSRMNRKCSQNRMKLKSAIK